MRAVDRLLVSCIVLAACCLAAVVVEAEDTQARKEADWRALAKLSVQFVGELDSQGKFTSGGGAYMTAYAAWKDAFVPVWAAFRERYGATWESVQPHFEGLAKPQGVPQGIEYVFRAASRIDLPKHEAQLARWAAQYGREQHHHWQRMWDQDHENVEVMMRHADRAAGFSKLAAKLDPAGDYAAGIRAGETAVEQTLPRYVTHLKEKAWPAHVAAYQGADSPDALAAAALAFLRAHPDWTAPEFDDRHVPVAAVVSTSEWKVSKSDWLTGAPLQHSIRMLVAFTGEKHPELAYCYFMEFYTSVGPDVQAALPFEYANSRQFECYRMLREKLPQ